MSLAQSIFTNNGLVVKEELKSMRVHGVTNADRLPPNVFTQRDVDDPKSSYHTWLENRSSTTDFLTYRKNRVAAEKAYRQRTGQTTPYNDFSTNNTTNTGANSANSANPANSTGISTRYTPLSRSTAVNNALNRLGTLTNRSVAANTTANRSSVVTIDVVDDNKEIDYSGFGIDEEIKNDDNHLNDDNKNDNTDNGYGSDDYGVDDPNHLSNNNSFGNDDYSFGGLLSASAYQDDYPSTLPNSSNNYQTRGNSNRRTKPTDAQLRTTPFTCRTINSPASITQHDIDDTFAILSKINWRDNDEQKIADAKRSLDFLTDNEIENAFFVMENKLAVDLHSAISDKSGILQALPNDTVNNFLFHLIAKGYNNYIQYIADPDFCLYLIDLYHPLYTCMTERISKMRRQRN
jgi:hypothetical protein